MIIKKDYGLQGVADNGENLLFNHIQDIDPTLEVLNDMRREHCDGFSKSRNQRYIGSIPVIEFERNPILKEAMTNGCISEALNIFLRSDEGKRYVVNPLDTGKDGRIRIK